MGNLLRWIWRNAPSSVGSASADLLRWIWRRVPPPLADICADWSIDVSVLYSWSTSVSPAYSWELTTSIAQDTHVWSIEARTMANASIVGNLSYSWTTGAQVNVC